METHLLPPDHPAQRVVREITGIGIAFMDSLSTLVELLEDADPESGGEHAAEQVFAMAAGSIDPVLRARPPEDVELAIELLDAVHERYLSDLKLAAEIAGRRERMRS